MRADRIGETKKARRLHPWAPWLCLLASLFAIAMVARPGLSGVLAQSSSPQATSLQDLTGPAPDPSAQAHLVEPAAKQETHTPPPTDPQQKQIYDDGANLLKLANTLKAEVDKTTADTLSLAVIRRADEIEKLAHKMRTK
jgi:hypothetical protein